MYFVYYWTVCALLFASHCQGSNQVFMTVGFQDCFHNLESVATKQLFVEKSVKISESSVMCTKSFFILALWLVLRKKMPHLTESIPCVSGLPENF